MIETFNNKTFLKKKYLSFSGLGEEIKPEGEDPKTWKKGAESTILFYLEFKPF